MSTKVSKNPVVAYFQSAFEEFGKITWPTQQQTIVLTGVTILISIVVVIFIALVDLGLSELYQYLLDIL